MTTSNLLKDRRRYAHSCRLYKWRVWRLSSRGSEILARLEAVEKRLGTSLAATQDATLDILREEVTRLEALVTDLRDKGAVPVGAVVTKESAPNLSGLIGKVPLFSSEKETRCSFETWARLFEDHAKLRGVPEEEWATLGQN